MVRLEGSVYFSRNFFRSSDAGCLARSSRDPPTEQTAAAGARLPGAFLPEGDDHTAFFAVQPVDGPV